MEDFSSTKSWGVRDTLGAEIWDANPVFSGERVGWKDWLKLLFYPKKFLLYLYLKREKEEKGNEKWEMRNATVQASNVNLRPELRSRDGQMSMVKCPFRILDLGCGTGSTVIDFKKMFGRSVEVIGIDVVKMQVELAREKVKKYGVWAEFEWYDGINIPFPAEYFDAVYTSDVLGHVADVPAWLDNINRVLKPDGVLAMFSESRLGKHAYVRRYLFDRGLNVDPHAEFHISLFSKTKLKAIIEKAGFEIKKMRSVFWASFFVHPDEFYQALSKTKQFPFLRTLNSLLYHLKKVTHPFSTAVAELYGLLEMLTVGRWVEGQGYVIVARKKG